MGMWNPESMPTNDAVQPDPSLPLPTSAPRSPLVAGFALGMTERDVLAICSRRTKPTIRATRAALNREGREVSPAIDSTQRLGEPYLTDISCFSNDSGLTQIQFAAPPISSVVQIDHRDYTLSPEREVSNRDYLAQLDSSYKEAVKRDHLAPEAIHGTDFAITHKWVFAPTWLDWDCAPPVTIRERRTYGVALIEGLPCPTHLTVRIAQRSSGAAFAADYKLLNIRWKMDAQRAQLAQINARFGTSLRSEAADELERLGRIMICTELSQYLVNQKLKSERSKAFDALLVRLWGEQRAKELKPIVSQLGIGDRFLANMSHEVATATCELLFAEYDKRRSQ
jgi:hypothetical protein